MSLSNIINQINNLTGYNIPSASGVIISSSQQVGSGSVNNIINYINGITGYNVPNTDIQYVSGSNVAGPIVIYTPFSSGDTISTEGILPGRIIRAEHVLRIIYALSGITENTIIISGSLFTSGSNILNGTLSLPFIDENKFLYVSGGYVVGIDTPPSASFAVSSSYSISSSFATNASSASYFSGSVSNADFAVVAGLALAGSGSFSGSFSGSGADLSGIPASAIIGLNLSQITSGSYSASISEEGLLVNNAVIAPAFTGSLYGTASWAQSSETASFITSSNVYGPFGANSIVSSSYALTASYALNVVAGTSGTSGESGTSGTSGANGTSGTSGASGTNGTSGTSGISGTSGTSGTRGSSGTSGTSGTSLSTTATDQQVLFISGSTVTGSNNLTYDYVNNVLSVTGSTIISSSAGNSVFSANADTLIFTGSIFTSGSIVSTGSLNITSITSSLFGTASYALNYNDPFRITTGSIEASVSIDPSKLFLIKSGSQEFFNIKSNSEITVSSDLFIIKNFTTQQPVLVVSESIVRIVTSSAAPTGAYEPGAIWFTSNDVYVSLN